MLISYVSIKTLKMKRIPDYQLQGDIDKRQKLFDYKDEAVREAWRTIFYKYFLKCDINKLTKNIKKL